MKPRTLLFISLACFALAFLIYVAAGMLFARGYIRVMRHTASGFNELIGQGAGEAGQPAQSNGEHIYTTGVNSAGERIPFTGGPHWLSMHGGSCADCHGRRGRGGVPVRMAGDIAPDIRYRTLTAEEEEHGKAGKHEHERYTDADIKRAITKGIEPDGHSMSLTMPRWQMSDKDLDDLIAYLKELDQQP